MQQEQARPLCWLIVFLLLLMADAMVMAMHPPQGWLKVRHRITGVAMLVQDLSGMIPSFGQTFYRR